jgi:predicted DNA-binding transcriptional regulator AlpA
MFATTTSGPDAGLAPTDRRPRLLSAKRLVELYPDLFSLPTLQRWRSTGIGPRYVLCGPRKVAYRIEDVDAWIASRAVSSTADAKERGLSTSSRW